MKADYRADIDGLRAIAVLSVLLFHGGFSAFGGGYVGVDIFFVISGYLITGIVLREVEDQRFSVLRFYERRVRRIFPALFVTLAITMGIGAVLLVPSKFRDLAASVVAVTLFASNILFWRQNGYFDLPAESKPLLHTWSLAVEEQFYILFPLLLVCIRRFLNARYARYLGLIATASLGLSLYATYARPLAAFYLAPMRSWELLIGALIACGALKPLKSVSLRNAIAALGLIFIGLSIFLFDSQTPFPGFAAFLPTIGAALVIHTGSGGGNTTVSRLLSAKPLVFVGLISYSLYLLHWPLIVFAKQLAITELPQYQMAGLLVLSLGVAALGWRFVEMPFRSRELVTRRQLFALAGVTMSGALAVALLVFAKDGLPQRFDAAVLGKELQSERSTRGCFGRVPSEKQGLCELGNLDAKPSFLLWGDSHAGSLSPALNRSALRNSAHGYLALKAGCPPLLGIERPRYRCGEFTAGIMRYIDSRPDLQTIILVSRWSFYSLDKDMSDGQGVHGSDADSSRFIEIGLNRTVQQLLSLGRKVVLVDGVPEVGHDVPSAYAVAKLTGRDVNSIIGQTREQYAVRNQAISRIFDRELKLKGVRSVDLSEKLCSDLKCRVVDPGHSLYADDNHISIYGALLVSPLFDKLFATPSGEER